MLATLRTSSNALRRSITSFAGQPIQCKAAVARGVNDLRIEEITVRRLKQHTNNRSPITP